MPPTKNVQHSPPIRICIVVALAGIVILSGGAVMVYEFIAVRILQRFFGSSLDVWAAEISVCLAGLSIGYSLGGTFADRYRSWAPLGLGLIAGGLAAFFIEPIVIAVSGWLPESEAVRWWEPLVVAGASSFTPMLALGTVMPQAIRLHVRDLSRVGSGAGRMAALSTIGSIVGVLLTAMVFIPWGVRESLYATSTALVVVGLGIVLAGKVGARTGRAALVIGMMCFLGCAARAQVIYEDYSAYHHILVKDVGTKRVLYFDNDPESTMDIKDISKGGFEYTDFFHVPMILNPKTETVLFVGLGGGTGPKSFLYNYRGLHIDVAEIDPAVVQVAAKYFSVPQDPRLHIVTSDGRTFLQRSKKTYGAIIMDAYGSGPHGAFIPYHLATQEFFKAAYEHLSPGGSLVYNVMGELGGVNDDVIRGMLATLESVFQGVYAYQAESSYNTVFIAQKLPKEDPSAGASSKIERWPDGPEYTFPITADKWVAMLAQLRGKSVYVPERMEHRFMQQSGVVAAPRTGKAYTDNKSAVDISVGLR